jgi:mRNA-degrading endonuclease YafQ of YafQ-DinJ toxin-antitoxin module
MTAGANEFHGHCHLEPDWLLYRVTEAGLIRVRTGSHAGLFE